MVELITDGRWNHLIDTLSQEAQQKVRLVEIKNMLDKDRVVWNKTSSCQFTHKSAYDTLKPKQQKRIGKMLFGGNG